MTKQEPLETPPPFGKEAQQAEVQSLEPLREGLRRSLIRIDAHRKISELLDGIPSAMLSAKETLKVGNPATPLLEFLRSYVPIEERLHAGAALEEGQENHGKLELLAEHAAHDSLLDYVRTKKFCSALISHLQELERLHPTGEIRVVDAGCGPIPILSIVAALHSPRIKVTAIESNHSSHLIAQEFFDTLGIADQIELRREDATKTSLPGQVHLLVSETLNTGFISEAFVYIMKHLVPQLPPEARTIPMRIELQGAITGEKPENQHRVEVRYFPNPMNTGFLSYPDLDFQTFHAWTPHTPQELELRCANKIPWSDIESGKAAGYVVRTHMTLFSPSREVDDKQQFAPPPGTESIALEPDESLITRTEHLAWFSESVRMLRKFNPKYESAESYLVSANWRPGDGTSGLSLSISPEAL
jgi:hypothetical protein